MADSGNALAGAMTKMIALGASAGGIAAATNVLKGGLHVGSPPLVMVMHWGLFETDPLAWLFRHCCPGRVKEAEAGEQPAAPAIYLAPANYHLLLERDGTFSLSVDDRVNWSRPSIDVFFDSAAVAHGKELVAVILSGANSDGADGAKQVADCGGQVLIQDPRSAAYPEMPRAALRAVPQAKVCSLDELRLEIAALRRA